MNTSMVVIGAKVAPFLYQATQTGTGTAQDDQFSQQIALEAIRNNPGRGPVGIIVPIGFFALILGLVWLKRRQQQAQLQAKADFHKQLLDKFSSGRDFADFLESKGSQRFLEALWSQGTPSKEKTLRNGIVVAMLGLAFFALAWMNKEFVIPGVLFLAVGAGFLIFFAISYRLSKSCSLVDEPGRENPPVS